MSDYIKLAKDLIGLPKSNKIPKEKIEVILSHKAKSRHRSDLTRTYHDLIEGRFDVEIKRIERKSNVRDDIANKLSDYSTDTIKQLIDDGYNDALKLL